MRCGGIAENAEARDLEKPKPAAWRHANAA
jgi:hypothetical protein